jgi:PAB-dependent poly(A)-specific ribonuclease subunit 2
MSNEVSLPTDFASIFKASVARENVTKATCSGCRHFANARVRRQLTGSDLPPVLVVNTAVHTSDHMEVWLDSAGQGAAARFLQPRIAINRTGTLVKTLEGGTEATDDETITYELRVRKVCGNIVARLRSQFLRQWSYKYKPTMIQPIWCPS